MPSNVKQSDLMVWARQRANMESSVFVSDAEVQDLTKKYVDDLYDLILEFAGGEETFTSKQEFDVVANVSDPVPLAGDFYRLKAVMSNASGRYVNMPRYVARDFAQLLNVSTYGGTTQNSYKYSVISAQGSIAALPIDALSILPTPRSVFHVVVLYVPCVTHIATDGVVWYNMLNGWEEWVVLSVAIALLRKEESDVSALLVEREALEQRIRLLADSRDSFQANTVRDSRTARRSPYEVDDDYEEQWQ